MIKIKVLNVSIKNTRFSKRDALPNQVHYNIAVNKRIKLLEEIYNGIMDRSTTFETTLHLGTDIYKVYHNKVDPVRQSLKTSKQLPFKNRHFIKSKN